MKTKLQSDLRPLLPSVSILTIWEHDADLRDIRKDCNGMDDEDPADWQAWQSEVRASAIVGGEEVSGSAYLGGNWEKAGDLPEESNPEISGYEAQMTVEALEELTKQAPSLAGEVARAVDFIRSRQA
jgi:hypothetical protein